MMNIETCSRNMVIKMSKSPDRLMVVHFVEGKPVQPTLDSFIKMYYPHILTKRCDGCKWWDEYKTEHTCINDAIAKMVTGAIFPPVDFYCKYWEKRGKNEDTI
jgi:hypothetical protein